MRSTRLKLSLPGCVEEPECQDVFECVINLGAHKSSFIPELIRFGSKFVNQKLRRLRLQAFVDTNKVNINCPRTKIASLKRAYRKNPSHGYCPTPEAKFHKAPLSMVLKLEELLHYFHVCCKAAVAVLDTEHQQDACLANVDVCAAEAFVTASEKFTLSEMQKPFAHNHPQISRSISRRCGTEHAANLGQTCGVGGFQNLPKRKE